MQLQALRRTSQTTQAWEIAHSERGNKMAQKIMSPVRSGFYFKSSLKKLND